MTDVNDTLADLSLTEKAALLSGENTWQTRAIPALGVPRIWMADGPHGVRKQIGSADHLGINGSEPATCFPTAATVANSWDESLAEEIGAALGREASEQGVHVLLGPGLNIKRSPLGGRNFEYFSEDPELAGRLAAAYVRGIQSEGVAASPKHFAVNSQELRRMVSDSIVDERTLRELYLTAFEIVVQESAPWTVMSSYNLVNGEYAHENTHLLQHVLRDEWGFGGAVVSDWGGSNDAVAAVRAGGTIEMPSPGFDSAREIEAAVRSGALDEADLDARVREVLTLVARVTARPVPASVDVTAHRALARRAAAESAVLLRNENRMLPLATGTRVALIGDFATTPRYQGAGSSLVNARDVSTLAQALGASTLDLVGTARGFRRDGVADAALVSEARSLAASADVVILTLGLPEIAESEGSDRVTLALPADQIALMNSVAAVNARVVVVLSAGGVVEVPALDGAAALVHGYLGGEAGAEGMADVLTGVAEPGGRLSESMPLRLADTPTAGRFPSTARTAEYREALSVGYRWYDASGTPVAFPFGFGLGYTTFAYSDLRVQNGIVTVTVTNTGERAGSDVVQVYVGRSTPSRMPRPTRELKGFSKVRLEPGASTTVRVPLGDRAFRYFDVDLGSWQVEGGEYDVSVGHHSGDHTLSETVHVEESISEGAAASDQHAARAEAGRVLTDSEFAALLGHDVPAPGWGSGPLGYNDPIDRISTSKSALVRLVFRILDRRRRKAEASGHPDLNILFMFNAPFRVLSKMSGGLATRRLTEAVLTVVNGQVVRGVGAVVSAYFRGRRLEKTSRERFRAASERPRTTRRSR
ncbi:glycoside hydrolase family 3 C-terminal domain-containing protein [Microbacterium sp. cx-55]|uniref:glycoside hydrolase family 3 C-terminal domain-containing protein n=1 Tax=Microbacterium sp. cx-55 TaxID=2875948 RepID=UPI001CBD2AC6|nr:glycoside hydrolase family 3 C-terminal domain-containing protein [Microbacterium sp. cx-55]UGB34837.1 glycoside hydrolase family 3 C-terminal domain-containing protein [Microbacterium sp. cx-55]